jgi:hypothetical protein
VLKPHISTGRIIRGQVRGKRLFFTTLDKGLLLSEKQLADLGAIEDIIMVGYPIGLWDSINNQPIVTYLPCPFWGKASNFRELFESLPAYVATIKPAYNDIFS